MDHRQTLALLMLTLLGLSQAHTDVDSWNESGDDDDDVDMTSMILEMNSGSREFLVEGDLMYPKTRNALKCWNQRYNCLWKKSANGKVEVPYKINNDFTSAEKKKIERALKEFHSKTCIRFVPHMDQKEYISFESKSGCFSSLGRTGRKQVVSLQRHGCVHHSIIQHEVLHALGFYHEQTRSDRDQYVKINWKYVPQRVANNFKKQDTNNLNTPYDYSSVMHYGRTAFTNSYGKETITPIPDSTVSIGQRVAMSKIDIMRINKLYKCEVAVSCSM